MSIIDRCIHHDAVLMRDEIDFITNLNLDWPTKEKLIVAMKNEQLSELLMLIQEQDWSWRFIDEQRRWDEGYAIEQRIRQGLKEIPYEEIEPFIMEEWRKRELKKLT